MEKTIGVVFSDEKGAYEGVKVLRALDAEPTIAIHAITVLKKKVDGPVATDHVDGKFPLKTFAGTAIGCIIGALGGPVGIGIGAAASGLCGLIGSYLPVNWLAYDGK